MKSFLIPILVCLSALHAAGQPVTTLSRAKVLITQLSTDLDEAQKQRSVSEAARAEAVILQNKAVEANIETQTRINQLIEHDLEQQRLAKEYYDAKVLSDRKYHKLKWPLCFTAAIAAGLIVAFAFVKLRFFTLLGGPYAWLITLGTPFAVAGAVFTAISLLI